MPLIIAALIVLFVGQALVNCKEEKNNGDFATWLVRNNCSKGNIVFTDRGGDEAEQVQQFNCPNFPSPVTIDDFQRRKLQ